LRYGIATWHYTSKHWYCRSYTKRATWKFEYSKQRVQAPDGKMRFKATRWKETNTRGNRVVQERFFQVKWRARDWCYKQWCKYEGETFESLHVVSEGRRKAGHKLLKVKKLRTEGIKAGLKPVRRRKILRKKNLKEE